MASSGTVKTYNAHKGWGFIDMNGIDIFLNKKDLKGIVVEPGTPVTFNVSQTPKGQQANDVTVIMNPEQACYLGKIKSFNPQKGFGFITAEAFPGQDIFVLKTDLPNGMAPEGAEVKFKMVMGQKGPQAKEVGLLGTAGKGGGKGGGMGGMEEMMAMMMSAMGGGGMDVWKPMFQKMGKGKGKGNYHLRWLSSRPSTTVARSGSVALIAASTRACCSSTSAPLATPPWQSFPPRARAVLHLQTLMKHSVPSSVSMDQ